MFWAAHGGDVEFGPPETMGTFKVTIDADCLIEGGDGLWIVGQDQGGPKVKGMSGMVAVTSCMALAILCVLCKFIKHNYIDGLTGKEKYELL